MAILLAEDLLLLLLDDARGDLPVRGGAAGQGVPDAATQAVEIVLGAAVLMELDLARAVTLRGGTPGLPWEVVLTPTAYAPGGPADEPLLRAALQRVEQAPWEPDDLVARLGEGLPGALAARLVERGQVQPVVDGGPGIFGQVRWPAADLAREQDVRRRLLDVLVAGVAPDPWARSLIALLTAAHLLELLVPEQVLPLPEAYRRGAFVTGESWPATAMQRAAARLSGGEATAGLAQPAPEVAVAAAQPNGVATVVTGVAGGLAAGFIVGFVEAVATALTEQGQQHQG